MHKYIFANIRQLSPLRVIYWLQHGQLPESAVLAIMAMLVGLTTGVIVWLFNRLFKLVYNTAFGGIDTPLGLFHNNKTVLQMFDTIAHWTGIDRVSGIVVLGIVGNWMIYIIPVIGGLVVGFISYLFIGRERYQGIAGVMEAFALGGGRLPYRKLPAKTVAAALSIGSGASVGPSDQAVQIGAYSGSMFGQLLRFSDERIRALLASGVAGGFAAAFNAPIAGIFFALEIVIGEISIGAFGVVALGAVVASVFTQTVSGPQPAFSIPGYMLNSVWELPIYFGLGVLCGLGSAFYIWLHHSTRILFDKWTAPRWLKPAVAGIFVGLAGIYLPQTLGTGYDFVEKVLYGHQSSVAYLMMLAFAKLILTPICISSGFHGGVFAPSLFSGAMLGNSYGMIMQQVFPHLNITPPAFAMVGMAAVFGSTLHAPITSFILLFELTHDYRIILPLIAAVNVSMFISWHLQQNSVYTLGLALKGVKLQRGRDVDVLETITVKEIMETEITTLCEHDSLSYAEELLLKKKYHGLPVIDNANKLMGIITTQDIDRAYDDNSRIPLTVGENCTRELLVVYPDDTIAAALQRIGVRKVSQLPVVDRNNPYKLVGFLHSTDIARAYELALTRRRAASKHKNE